MTTTDQYPTEAAAAEIPAVPLTIEGYSALHQMMRFRWTRLACSARSRQTGDCR